MARLCTQMNPLLEERVLKRLHQRKIFTIVDILQENADKLIQITKLSYKEILQIRQNIIANYSAFPVKGIDAYNEILSNTALIPSGIESLDAMIGGGFLTGKIYEVCGSSGSGKTQLCLTVSAHIAHDFKQEVHYIDTKTDFSGKRVQEVLESKGYHDEVIGAVMERIRVTRIKDVYELFSFLQHLKTSLHHDQDGHHSVRIIILDSLPALFFPFLGKNLNDGLTLMNQMANTMKYIVTEYHVTFLVVNLAMQLLEEENVAGDGSNECIPQDGNLVICDTMKPALGKYWLDIPCTRLFIHKINSTERRQIAVMKSTSLSTKKRCKVLINQKGVISALGSE
ncbi:DNA repair protein RAD51 homolog 4 isoform X3 [Zootermopsis nevadensis]|uniref:DNA repair protein RAD51 homolog 4 isoform X3 n=1 Tax=Zootermopsis nevadensis TaxID=136037 RepID=UPI000B8EB088|nr:DNA repair protein RAD51 homolog 4 isoform X3 [Zootermopsis nevadensis]